VKALTGGVAISLLVLPGVVVSQTTPELEPGIIQRISTKVAITPLDLPQSRWVGAWSSGGGLTGCQLYVFQDDSYVYTEWGCLEPETIHDKGSWQVTRGVLTLASDSDVTWQPSGDRKYATFRLTNSPRQLLIGLDFQLRVFESVVREMPTHAATLLTLASFRRDREWRAGEGLLLKSQLMKRNWRPEYFQKQE